MNRAQLPGRDRVGTDRFESFLRRLLSIKGVVAPDVEGKLQASIELTRTPWDLAELALSAGWRGFEAAMQPSAVAAQYSFAQLIPPATGNILVVVEQFVLYGGIAGVTYVTAGIRDVRSAGAAANTNIQSVDARYGSLTSLVPAPACSLSQGSNVTVPGTVAAVYTQPVGYDSTYRGPWILPSGNGGVRTFQLLALNVNNTFQATVRWWERSAEPSELVLR